MAERISYKKLIAPLAERIIDSSGLLSHSWESFFRLIQELLSPLGQERSYEITNNLGVAADIKGLSFDKRYVACAFVDLFVQRVTASSESNASISAILQYKAKADAWEFVSAPTLAGAVFSVTADGQVQYTSSNITGTIVISKVTWRARTLAAKHHSYSVAGSLNGN